MPPKANTGTEMDKDLFMMWLCIKNSDTPTLKIDWDAVAKKCEINKAAAQKRWSRLLKRLEEYVPPAAPANNDNGGANNFTAVNANGNEVEAVSPVKTPNKKQKKTPAATPASKAGAGTKRKRGEKDVGVKDELDEESPVKAEGKGGIPAAVGSDNE